MTRPRPFDLADFLARCAAASPYAQLARSAHEQGASVTRTGPIPGSQVLAIYRQRAAHLSTIRTEHATRLSAELDEVCAALQRVPAESVSIVDVTAEDGRSFIFFEDSVSHELLGSALSYDARVISDEEYLQLWGKPRLR